VKSSSYPAFPGGPFPAFRSMQYAAMMLAALALTACGKTKESGQALVKVNGEEITIHQLNTEVSHTNGQVSNKKILEALIDRQLLVEAAKSEKTDADPAVLQELERTRNQILMQGYLQRKLGAAAKPSSSEVNDFYTKNPDLFAQRRQYDLNELVIDAKDLSPQLATLMGTARSIDEVADWLQSKQIKFSRVSVARTSADLPPPIASGLKTMDKGRLFVIKDGVRTLLVVLQDVKSSPIALAAATPQIEQYLTLQKRQAQAAAEVARLRANAKIEYLSKSAALKDDAVEPPAVTMPAAAAAAAADVPAAAASSASAAADDHVSRGVAGLK
jgi:peptidyl-prolyl cis-trans isomerase C